MDKTALSLELGFETTSKILRQMPTFSLKVEEDFG
jgi:hypothetical protein